MESVVIGNNIRIARRIARNAKGYSQEALARSVGKSQTWMQQAEKGEIDFTISHINKLCKELDIEPKRLLFSCLKEAILGKKK